MELIQVVRSKCVVARAKQRFSEWISTSPSQSLSAAHSQSRPRVPDVELDQEFRTLARQIHLLWQLPTS